MIFIWITRRTAFVERTNHDLVFIFALGMTKERKKPLYKLYFIKESRTTFKEIWGGKRLKRWQYNWSWHTDLNPIQASWPALLKIPKFKEAYLNKVDQSCDSLSHEVPKQIQLIYEISYLWHSTSANLH